MPKYYVMVHGVTAHCEIEADSAEDAEEKAIARGLGEWDYDFNSSDDAEVTEA